MTTDPTGDDWLDQRLANRRKPGDPDYDAFYDASDEQLTAMMTGPAKAAPIPVAEQRVLAALAALNWRDDRADHQHDQGALYEAAEAAIRAADAAQPDRPDLAGGQCGTCWACRAQDLDDPAARVVRAAIDWRAFPTTLGSTADTLTAAVDGLLAAPACVDLDVPAYLAEAPESDATGEADRG